jgi:5-methylcytosine-specific restriction endonuclease McrA
MSRFKIDFLPEYTDDALLAELRRVAALLNHGEPLTQTTYRRLAPRVAHNTVRRRFGGWKEALEKAGLKHLYCGQPVSAKMRQQPAKALTNDDLIRELKRVHALVGKDWLTSSDFNRHSVTSAEAIRQRFGTFRKALDQAGIPHHPFKAREFTDAQCFETIANVWIHYGRAPEYREMFKPPSLIRGKTYVTRWGTWRKTLQAFVDWSNAESEAPATVPSVTASVHTPERVNGTVVRAEADCRDVRPGLRFKVFSRDRFRCVACGRSPATDLRVELHADHILAVANGGKTVLENLQTLCQDCNLGKGRSRGQGYCRF